MIFKTLYSPNFTKKARKTKDINLIILHYTGMQSKIASIKRLLDPNFKVSCHYLIDRQGQILKMVEDNKIAWHAGKSKWSNFKDLNKHSLGIELVNRGHRHGYEKFTTLQIKNLIKLCLTLKRKYKIKNSNIIGHSDVAPLRKKDPGEKFPWKQLHKRKVGVWYLKQKFNSANLTSKKIKNLFFYNLFRIGYRYLNKNKSSKNNILLIKAFQRRFVQNKITGKIDPKTFKISQFLANSIKK